MVLLKLRREEKGMSQYQLSLTSGVPQQTISAIESGSRRNPGVETLYKLATALGITMEKLYAEEAGRSDDPGICGATGNVGRYEGGI